MMEPVYQYRASLRRVIDGDTYILDVDLGFRIYAAITIRLHNFDTPEMVGPDRARGLAAKEAVTQILSAATTIIIVSYKDAMSFARWIADVWVDGRPLQERLAEGGHAK